MNRKSQQDLQFEQQLRIAEHIVRVLREVGYCELGDGPRAGLYFATHSSLGGSKNLRCTIPGTGTFAHLVAPSNERASSPRSATADVEARGPSPVVSDGADRNAGTVPLMKTYARAAARDHHTVHGFIFSAVGTFCRILSVGESR